MDCSTLAAVVLYPVVTVYAHYENPLLVPNFLTRKPSRLVAKIRNKCVFGPTKHTTFQHKVVPGTKDQSECFTLVFLVHTYTSNKCLTQLQLASN